VYCNCCCYNNNNNNYYYYYYYNYYNHDSINLPSFLFVGQPTARSRCLDCRCRLYELHFHNDDPLSLQHTNTATTTTTTIIISSSSSTTTTTSSTTNMLETMRLCQCVKINGRGSYQWSLSKVHVSIFRLLRKLFI